MFRQTLLFLLCLALLAGLAASIFQQWHLAFVSAQAEHCPLPAGSASLRCYILRLRRSRPAVRRLLTQIFGRAYVGLSPD